MITVLESELNFWFTSYSQPVIKEMLIKTLQNERLVNTILDCYGSDDFENDFFFVRRVMTNDGGKYIIVAKYGDI